jgi:hypothetical protein
MRSNVPAIAIAASLAAYMPRSKVDSVAAADLVAITPVIPSPNEDDSS